MGFLDAAANGLLEKGILTMHDVAKIKETCPGTSCRCPLM